MKIGRRTVLRGLAVPLAWTLGIGSAKAFWRRDVDVLVVGAGGAGLAAGVAAAQEGASVLVLEKEAAIGGNTLRASGLFNAADPKRQGPMGVRDSVEWHAEQTLESGGGRNDPERRPPGAPNGRAGTSPSCRGGLPTSARSRENCSSRAAKSEPKRPYGISSRTNGAASRAS